MTTGVKTWHSLNEFGSEDLTDPAEKNIFPDMSKLWPEWHKRAACLNKADDTLFFGEPKNGVYQPSGIKEAKAFCSRCPVFEECLRFALQNREAWGVWASTTNKERRLIFDGLDSGLFDLEEIVRDRLEDRDEQRGS